MTFVLVFAKFKDVCHKFKYLTVEFFYLTSFHA